jgi:BirA family transcriptional regulator, biotin operon repressor / biotin---[acetyl-CoA-carboxylase] ligase
MPLNLVSIRTALPGRQIVWLDSTGSTMTEAATLVAANCPSGAVVVAEEQTSGQGRHGRRWQSERETGLYLSLILRLSLAPDSLPVLTLALGLAVQDAIERSAGVPCDLRWPNDVLAGGKKCAGILVQLVEGAAIAGFGVNVNNASFPAEISGTATSLRLVSGRKHSREQLTVCLLEAIDVFCGILLEDGKEQILRLYCRGSSFVSGRRVAVTQGDSTLEGTTEGLDPSGFLVLRKEDGTRSLILAGGVRPHKM